MVATGDASAEVHKIDRQGCTKTTAKAVTSHKRTFKRPNLCDMPFPLIKTHGTLASFGLLHLLLHGRATCVALIIKARKPKHRFFRLVNTSQ